MIIELKREDVKKMTKYQDLAREIRRLWNTSSNVIPIVIGALEEVASLDEYIKKKESRQSTVFCSIRKSKDTEKSVGYL